MKKTLLRTHYVNQITPDLFGKSVTVAGWVHEIRNFGNLTFVILRDQSGLIQITLKKGVTAPELFETTSKLVKETAIVCTGLVNPTPKAAIGRELTPTSLEVIGPVLKQVPFEVTGKVPADLDVRLDHRFIDLRRLETTAVFKIRSAAQRAFREKLLELSFQEITTPCIVASSTEGGTDLFSVKYFEKQAFLAQSPQLYKQLAVMGGMDKVFMVSPVFRAEKHNTTQHLNEITQMDAEMGFADDEDALNVLEVVFLYVLASVKKNCVDELKTLGVEVADYKEIPRFTYDHVLDALAKKGVKMKGGEDFSKEVEQKIPDALGTDLFFITRWPTACRAFYSMPVEGDESKCKAYDLVYKGLEIASGAQRIHKPDLLIKQLKAKDLHPSIDAFRYGAVPHAGWSIGLERLTQKLTNRENIRECALFPRDRTRLTP